MDTTSTKTHFYEGAGVIGMANILVVYFVPLPILWKLQITSHRKRSLAVAFMIGSL